METADAAAQVEGGKDPEADEIERRLEGLRGFSSKRNRSADAHSPVVDTVVHSRANQTDQFVNLPTSVAGVQQVRGPANAPIVSFEHLQTSSSTHQEVLDGVRMVRVDDATQKSGPERPTARHPQVRRAASDSSVPELTAKFEELGGHSRSSSVGANERVGERTASRRFTSHEDLMAFRRLPRSSEMLAASNRAVRSSEAVQNSGHVVETPELRSTATTVALTGRSAVGDSAAAMPVVVVPVESLEDVSFSTSKQQLVPASRLFAGAQSPVASGTRTTLRDEFDTLLGFRHEQKQGLSAIKNGDPFRGYWQSIGGVSFNPPVPPTAQNKEVPRKLSDLEKVNVKLAESRARGGALSLAGILPQRTQHGRTMQNLVDSAALALQSNLVFSSGDARETASTASVGAEPGENATPRAAEHHVLVAKEMFNSPITRAFKRHPSPTVDGLKRVS
ncbi:MAG: hypothetical protein ACREPC_03940, partial [Stenotrophomonas sp.]